jgi:hypothetical protein
MLRMMLSFFLLRKVFVLLLRGVAGAKPPRGSGRSPEQASSSSGLIECLRRWLPPFWCASYADRT